MPHGRTRETNAAPVVAVAAAMLVLAAALAVHGPVAQPAWYHAFADRRALLGVPGFANVASNVVLLVAGCLGLRHCLRAPRTVSTRSWLVVFAGASLVAMGSSYYHARPSDATLVWDRLPMTLAFMGCIAALAADYVNERLGARLLLPLVALGIAAVAVWRYTGDLRLYALVQVMPLLATPAALLLSRKRHGGDGWLWAALACYALAKAGEALDHPIFAATASLVSGHTAKHVLAGLGVACFVAMLRARDRDARSATAAAPA